MAKARTIFEIRKNVDAAKVYRVTDRDGVARVWAGTESARCQFRYESGTVAIDLANVAHGTIQLAADGIVRLDIKQTHVATLAVGRGWFDVYVLNSANGRRESIVEGSFKVVEGVTT